MINNLPPSIIEIILCLLPIEEAVRTSILSREWRYRWTKIPKLVFIVDITKISINGNHTWLGKISHANSKYLHAINQVVSTHQGPIHEFSLSMYAYGFSPSIKINHIIDHLSRSNTVNKLTLGWVVVSESLFSLHKLTDLDLDRCCLDVQQTFNGFNRLASLYMEDVMTTNKQLLLFLSSCPLLKTVNLDCRFGSHLDSNDCTIIKLFECLPVVENLSISLSMMEYFLQGRVPNKLPAALVHLKYLSIRDTLAEDVYRISCLAFLIRSCPNLEKLKLKVFLNLCLETTLDLDIWLENLSEIEIENHSDRCIQLDFVRIIMAKSPVLKKVKILHNENASREEVLEISKLSTRIPYASPGVQIIVESGAAIRFRGL